MEAITFSQEYYLQKASQTGHPFSPSNKSLNPRCREFKPKSFMYSGIHPTPSHPSRPKRKDHPKRDKKKGDKKEGSGSRDGGREWEWMEAELEEVKDVWEEDIGEKGNAGGNGIPVTGTGNRLCSGRGGGGNGGGSGGDAGVNGDKGWGIAVDGKPTAPRGKSWMIVSQKMMEEYSL
jgi:hypothetical protein